MAENPSSLNWVGCSRVLRNLRKITVKEELCLFKRPPCSGSLERATKMPFGVLDAVPSGLFFRYVSQSQESYSTQYPGTIPDRYRDRERSSMFTIYNIIYIYIIYNMI